MTEDTEWEEKAAAMQLADILTEWACGLFHVTRREAGALLYCREARDHEVKSGLVSVHLRRDTPADGETAVPLYTVRVQVFSRVQMELMRSHSDFENLCRGASAPDMADRLIWHFETYLVKGMWDEPNQDLITAATRTALFRKLLLETEGDLAKAMELLAPSIEEDSPLEFARASVARWLVGHHAEYTSKLMEPVGAPYRSYEPFFQARSPGCSTMPTKIWVG